MAALLIDTLVAITDALPTAVVVVACQIGCRLLTRTTRGSNGIKERIRESILTIRDLPGWFSRFRR